METNEKTCSLERPRLRASRRTGQEVDMYRKILVPLDGSPFAESALPVAGALAGATGADVALIRVVDVVAPGDREPGVISYLDEHRVAAAQDYIARATAQLALGRPVSAEAYLAADVPAGILARARDFGADLIVMTSHARSWPEETPLGSTAVELLREAECPVLIVGPRVLEKQADLAAAEMTP
jgi:nucleotide-binding universal stress UspA family protein